MKLVTIDNTASGLPGAVLKSGEILHFGKAAAQGTLEVWIPDSMRSILEAGPAGLALVRQLVERVEGAPASAQNQLREIRRHYRRRHAIAGASAQPETGACRRSCV